MDDFDLLYKLIRFYKDRYNLDWVEALKVAKICFPLVKKAKFKVKFRSIRQISKPF